MQHRVDYAFLHGGGQGSWVWDETIAALTAQGGDAIGRVFALDAPGCGTKRGMDTSGIDNRAIARDLIAEIEAAGLTQVVLVGHSQAGQVLPFMAELRPDLFRRLVYVSCSIPPAGRDTQALMGRSPRGTHPDEIGWPFDPATTDVAAGFGAMFCNDMSADAKAAFLAKLGQDAWPAETYAFTDWTVDAGAVPALYVVCLQDNILPPAWQDRFAAAYGVARSIRIDAGHQVMNTRPHALAEVLRLDVD